MAKIIGIGAVMIYANNPVALADWYGATLGIKTSSGNGCHYGDLQDPETGHAVQFAVFPAKEPLAPGLRSVMVNYQVDDFDRFIGALEAAGTPIERRFDSIHGRFAHLRDPEGNRIEIWQAPAAQ